MDVRVRKVRITFIYLFMVGTVIVAASLLARRVIMDEVIGLHGSPTSLLGWIPFLGPTTVEGIRVAILSSEQTADYFAAMSIEQGEDGEQFRNNYLEIGEFWENYFRSRNIEVALISDREMLTRLDQFNLLVLPMTHCLSDQQIEAVKRFLGQRRGVLFTHLSGNRKPDGEERGWSLSADVVGGKPIIMPVRDDQPIDLHLLGETPLTAGAAPAFSLEISTFDFPLGIALREDRSRSAALWRDGGTPLPTGSMGEHAGIAFGNYLGGRFAWFGFSIQSVVSRGQMWEEFGAVIDNAVDWTAYRTVAGKAAWPDHRAAATFAIMPGRDFARAASLHEVLARQQIRPALFIRPDQALANRLIIEELAPTLELALQLQISPGRVKEAAANGDLEVLLRTGINELEKQVDTDFRGFWLPVGEGLNLDRLARFGFAYIWIDQEYHFVPRWKPLAMQPLFRRHRKPPVLLFHGAGVERQRLEQAEDVDSELMIDAMKKDFSRALELGGLFTATLRLQEQGMNSYLDRLEQWLQQLDRQQVWLASPGQIAEWWRQQSSVHLSLDQSTTGRLSLKISNQGRQSVAGLRIFLYPPSLPETIEIRAERIYTPIPDYLIDRERQRVELMIERMSRRENRTYYLTF